MTDLIDKSAWILLMLWHWSGNKPVSRPRWPISLVHVHVTWLRQGMPHWALQYVCALGPFQYRDHLSRYGDSHCKGKTVVSPYCIYNGNFYTSKMASLYWNGPMVFICKHIISNGIFNWLLIIQITEWLSTPQWKFLSVWQPTKFH